MSDKAESENDVILEMHHVGNYEEFSCIVKSLQCYDGNEDSEDGTVEQSAAKHQRTSEHQETDEDDKAESGPVTYQVLGSLLLDHDFTSCRKAMKAVA
jgi:hypothetical protein